jgi:exopolyphosphatase/guanosine-5'-triphosphate,3'-diphosphate pyrophosphatase
VHIVSAREEAQLTYLGVAQEREPAGPLIVVDIGGGSTEIGILIPGAPLQIIALPIGSARLTSTHLHHDPPTAAEINQLKAAVADIRADLPPAEDLEDSTAAVAVFVGGTATNVARLGSLTRAALAEDFRLLSELNAAAVIERFGVRPQRAPQLAAGAAIIDVLLDHFGLDEAVSSQASLRDGAIVADWHFGDEWPRRLGELVG